MIRVKYGERDASAHVYANASGAVSLSVHLDVDPGFGSMSFHNISPAVVRFVSGPADELRLCAEYIRTGAQFLTAGPGRDCQVALAAEVDEMAQAADESAFWQAHYAAVAQ